MKTITAFLLLLCGTMAIAQGRGTDVQVEYQVFFNTDSPMKMFTTLYVSGNVAVYQEKYSTKENWTEKMKPVEEKPGTHTFVSKGTPRADDFYRIDRNKKEILFYDYIMRNQFLVKDTYPEIKWAITEETKIVAGVQCIKAIGDFRGRQWIAWFAPEIALPFGPWKLQGLPGIILEAHDSTDKYAMKAVKVEYKSSDIMSKDFTKIYKTANKKPISYKQFLEDREEAEDNMHQEMYQTMKANGSSLTINKAPRAGEELKFEWEK